MAGVSGDDGELDDILDDALRDYEAGRDTSAVKTADEEPDSSSVDVHAAGSLEKSAARGPREQKESSRGDQSAEGARSAEDEAAYEAIDSLLKSLSLLPNGTEDAEEAGGPTEEEDLKIVEDFIQSFGAQLSGSEFGNAGGGINTGDDDEDRLAREMAAVFGASGLSDGITAPSATPGESSTVRPGTADTVDKDAEGNAATGGQVELEKFVLSVVGKLMSKEVLETPMQELRTAYAAWLPQQQGLSQSELSRYQKQRDLVDKICDAYSRDVDSSEILSLFQDLQQSGAPPHEVMQGVSSYASDDAAGDGAAARIPDFTNPSECPLQ